MNKKIANVVFYKFWDPTREEPMQQACIFYEDGSVENTTHDRGIDAAYEVANADKLTGHQFRTILNSKKVFTMTGEDFERRFQEFIIASRANVEAAINESMADVVATRRTGAPVFTKKTVPANPNKSTQGPGAEQPVRSNVPPVVPGFVPTGAKNNGNNNQQTGNDGAQKPGAEQPVRSNVPPVSAEGTAENNSQAQPKTQAEQAAEKANKKKKEKNKKKESLWQRFKKSKVGKRITALAVAIALALGLGAGYHLGRNSKEGQITNSNMSLTDIDQDGIQAQDQAYLNLLKETKNEDLRTIMTKQGENLDMFNRDFAAAYIEDGKEVKAALTWDEMVALNLAFNDYSKEQIRLMFNGAEVDSLAMSHAYKNATLQLMGAYVISDRETPVNMAAFVNSEEGKAFVEKYEDLFYQCKEATGDARIAAVNAFYNELFKDFPISNEVREEGLSHADARASVKPYMAAVTPMVAAAEIMFQNLNIDHTLSDKATAYFNDIGICNIAEDAFERAETITLAAETDESLPTYTQFMNTKITELIYEGNYPTDDAHRDLSQLAEFQKWVNGHFVFDENGNNTGAIQQNQTTHTETTTKTDTTTKKTSSREEAVSAAGESAVKDAEKEVDQQIAAENEAAKQRAEKEAEQKRQELQNAADQEAAELEEQVSQADQDLQENIADANDANDNGGTVNEDDLGHRADFDDEHSNENGDLDDSVTDITTDGSGAVDEDAPLPDPNEMGADFDSGTTSGETTPEDYYDEGIYSYEEPYYGGTGMSNEDIVNAYINQLESQSTDSTAKVYTK